MMVTWVTLTLTNYSIVEYNKGGFPLTLRATGTVTKFTDGGSQHRVLYMHRVKLTGLAYDQVYGGYWGTEIYLNFSYLIEVLNKDQAKKRERRAPIFYWQVEGGIQEGLL